MEVLIVSKTHMASAACVGGLVLGTNRYVRLLNAGNQNQPTDTDLAVGDVWEMRYIDRTPVEPPHTEDVIVLARHRVRTVNDMAQYLLDLRVIDWEGPIDEVFDGTARWTNSGTGYIPHGGLLPIKSVGFWIPDRPLVKSAYEGKVKYRYQPFPEVKAISYVGFQEAVAEIPAGTIIRVSLARLWPKEGSDVTAPKGYYIQLSGWYGANERRDLNAQRGPFTLPDDLDLYL